MSIKYQFQFIQAMRNHFNKNDFLDVITPPMVENPGMETHIHPFEVFSARDRKTTSKYLHTSPEFLMKELLSKNEFEKIFTISYCFRNEPISPIHREQFLICEWYRKGAHYLDIMKDVEDLIISLSNNSLIPAKEKFQRSDFQRVTIKDLFQQVLNIDILEYPVASELAKLIKSDFKSVPLPSSECSWDDYFFLLFLNLIEPVISNEKAIFLYEYPEQLSALSTLKKDDNRVCERFELYIRGTEICNCFNELTDINIQKERFNKQEIEKKKIYNYSLPTPRRFLNTIENGYPSSSGIALGVERLFGAITAAETIFFD